MKNSDAVPFEYWWMHYPFGMEYVVSLVTERAIMKGFVSWVAETDG